jgi:predicted TIM-barrel fold metal-dependent hydrolase
MMTSFPEVLKPLAGRIVDIDSHEHMPAQVWTDNFGEIAKPLAEVMMSTPPTNPNHANVQGYPGDIREITEETLWTTKGPISPGAVDMSRRVQVMDMMKIDRQLMFPTSIGLWGTALAACPEDLPLYKRFGDQSYNYAKKLFAANNEWAVGAAKVSPRIRPVTPVYGDSPDELISVTRRLLNEGIRAVLLVSSRLPGGVSPADDALDPFYAMLAEANVPLTLHIGGELFFFRTSKWGDARAFQGFKVNEETSMDPWRLSVLHVAPQNFVATMITGGVFDRHPALRMGIVEYGAHWVGPMADMLDLWHDNNNSIGLRQFADGSVSRKLPMRPSEYLARNVRVSPFDFEPVGKYIARHRELEDVYCFASDYPHVEGGKSPLKDFAESLAPLGEPVLEKFFVTNGSLLLPA